MSTKQIIVTSSLNTINVQDFLTGAQIGRYDESVVFGFNGTHCLFDQYFLSSQKDSSVLHLWSLRRKSSVRNRLKCPDNVTACAVTPDGCYIILALSEKVYIYMTASGQLCSVLERHYQPITVLRVSKCGSFFITGGQDGLVLVWMLFSILSSGFNEKRTDSHNPKHTWSQHSGKITDIHCGSTGIRGKCSSVSVDSTCKIFDLYSGQLLISITFDEPLWSVTMDPAQNYLFVGGEKGNIYETKLFDQNQLLTDLNRPPPSILSGNSAKVTHLAVSLDGLSLVSGAHDGKVTLFHILSKQVMKRFTSKGPITNLLIMPTPRGMLEEDTPLIPVRPFKLVDASELDPLEKDLVYILNEKHTINETESPIYSERLDRLPLPLADDASDNDDEPTPSNTEHIEELRKINQQIYEYSVENIFKNLISN